MKISLQWLSDFVDWTEKDPQVIADRLTAATGEIDDIEVLGRYLENCCVGKVITLSKHPNADKLTLCDVETDKGMKRVVCGGTNLKQGMLVAFAHTGATVKWHGGEVVTLAPVKIRGEQSEGMICAAEELELDAYYTAKPEDGQRAIMDITGMNLAPGTSLKQAFNLHDTILHIDNHAITNRPDLFSHIGIARECVALGLAKWKKEKKHTKPTFGKAEIPFKCINEIPQLIPTYRACLLSIDSAGQTPDWMKQRLEATGHRSINLPIDITNYVMTELGMPLHSFDSDDFKGDIHMRTAKAGEKLVTLDKVERVLPEGAIVISDNEGIFDLLGIMGGLRSSTKDTSKHLYLHSAQVDGKAIRKAVIATGHRTDAATVYEKGVAPITVEKGFERALELLLELVPGAKIISKMESVGKHETLKPIALPIATVTRMLGIDISEKEITSILTSLDFGVKKAAKGSKKNGATLTVTPPPHRIGDITGAHDLIEEIARIYGYNKIPVIMPEAITQLPERDERMNKLRTALSAQQYIELLNLSFTNAEIMKKAGLSPDIAVTIANPLGEELSRMRTHLLPAILQVTGRELKSEKKDLKLFEYGHVFAKGSESTQFCAVLAMRDSTTIADEPILQLKADILSAFSIIGYTLDAKPIADNLPPYAHPGRSALITYKGATVGLLCEIHPQVRKAFELPERAAAAIIDWQALTALPQVTLLTKPLALFPAISYDETIALPASMEVLLAELKIKNPLIESVQVVDLYQKDALKTATLRFVYRAADRTLEQKETDAIHAPIASGLKR
ncbi:MAG: phenylalanine--tRNA ligase subunit beta [Candidatus Peribacteraceae bacterium]|nr:phenylalanine--tRNA ligase subunit beta [Candidatus Peribacteraceae bacterium]